MYFLSFNFKGGEGVDGKGKTNPAKKALPVSIYFNIRNCLVGPSVQGAMTEVVWFYVLDFKP